MSTCRPSQVFLPTAERRTPKASGNSRPLTRIAALTVLAVTGLAANTIGPDAAGYTATDETAYSFVNIAPTGIRTLALTDDGTTSAAIGFPFTLYGQSYSNVCISSNGYLLFGGCTDAFLNQDLTVSPPPGQRPIVAPLWTDLTFLWPNADAVYHETLGAAPTRQFVVQWNNAFPQNMPQPVTLQVILDEGSNEIRFQYQKLDAGAGSPATNGGTATVGVCDGAGAATGRCLQWSYNAAVLHGEMAILIDPNTATADVVPGHMHGNGFIVQGGVRYEFQFDVRERASGAERGSFRLRVDHPQVGGQKPNDDRFVSDTVASAVFSDDPTIQPGRRPRPLVDTVLFSGVGAWNDTPGYRYEIFARDSGEPGPHRESISMTITSPSGAAVVQAGGDLAGGNVQSHRIH